MRSLALQLRLKFAGPMIRPRNESKKFFDLKLMNFWCKFQFRTSNFYLFTTLFQIPISSFLEEMKLRIRKKKKSFVRSMKHVF